MDRVTFDVAPITGMPSDVPLIVPTGLSSQEAPDNTAEGRVDTNTSVLLEPSHADPITDAAADDRLQGAAYKFCRSVVAYLCMGCTAVAVLNFVVNPYAQYPVALFQPVVQKSRAEKVQLLKSLAVRPSGLVLGSSRVLKIGPDYLQHLTGQTFFNAGVNYGRVEDMLAFVRLYESRYGTSPQCLVVGLDVAAFSDQAKVDPRLLNEPDLIRQLPEVSQLPGRFERWQELLSWQQTTNSVRCFLKAIRQVPVADPVESYRPDGVLQYHEREAQIAAGTYDFSAALDYNKHEYTQLLSECRQLSLERLRLWETLAKHCHTKRIQLAVFLTPDHPDLAAELHAKTRFAVFHEELRHELERLSDATGYRFLDLSDINSFGGDSAEFFDGIHPTEVNTRLMMNRLWQR